MRQAFFLCLLIATPLFAAAPTMIDIAPAWAGHPVGFALLTHQDKQFVGFYDADRNLTIAGRTLGSNKWSFKILPTKVKWDSHNYIAMVMDDDHQLHIAANLHGVPLVYFCTTKPMELKSLEQIPSMIGRDEDHCTYPVFMRGPSNEFIFTYRWGGSGNGNQIYNVYDRKSHTWSRLLDQPLTDGKGEMSAYFNGPSRGPDGYFHLAWVWRDTPDCETNHTPSYARSKDLRHWETAGGEVLALPITPDTPGVVVDPIPAHGGVINGNLMIGFDYEKHPIISYHKFDAAGLTQAYNARFDAGHWVIQQASNWSYRWDFTGRGSIPFEIGISAVHATGDRMLSQTWWHNREGSGSWRLDAKTLKVIDSKVTPKPPPPTTKPAVAAAPTTASGFPGLQPRTHGDSGGGPDPSIIYQLRWETLGPNRDKARPEPWPPPTMLRLVEIHR